MTRRKSEWHRGSCAKYVSGCLFWRAPERPEGQAESEVRLAQNGKSALSSSGGSTIGGSSEGGGF